jgi:hypothetical protein
MKLLVLYTDLLSGVKGVGNFQKKNAKKIFESVFCHDKEWPNKKINKISHF